MKGYLFDENIPTPLRFTPKLPVIAATTLGASLKDSELWLYAKDHQLTLVSKDADFAHRILQTSPPPWVVHLKFGNQRRLAFGNLLASVWPQIELLLPTHKLLRVFADRIESVQD